MRPPPAPSARRRPEPAAALALLLALAAPAGGAAPAAAELAGEHRVLLHGREGAPLQIGTVRFTPRGDGRSDFRLALDGARFQDFFLSMREFKCLEAPREVFCHVPYPHAQPGTVAPGDLAWLEHALLFMVKRPGEFGAQLWNGVYYPLRAGAQGLAGVPQAVDLNRISAPPDDPSRPPFQPALRDDLPPGARWFHRLTIE